MKTAWILFLSSMRLANIYAADSERGEQLFQSQGCIQCHAINGHGGTTGPDLGRRIARDYTPARFASTMWNHAPAMWSAMQRQSIQPKELDAEGAADLFAFFSSSRFFDKPGDAARGKQVFTNKRCAECHGIDSVKVPGAPPVSKWTALGDPVTLAESMWNHAGKMREEFVRRNVPWPVLSSQELADMLVYLRNLPATKNLSVHMQTTAGDRGEALFQAKGCEKCHTGSLDFRSRLQGKTLTDIAAAMWNHAPKMERAAIQFDRGEMAEVLSYLWMRKLSDNAGHPNRGEKVFREKQCAACHNSESGGAPHIGGNQSSLTMVSALWKHGPAMLDRMKEKGMAWPRLNTNDMSDLIAFLNTRR
jgi:mono/diheme cytochrome c family protein